MRPFAVIVTGMWGTGKTTLARRLATDLGLPLLSRDGLKESFYDALQTPSREVLEALGPASYGLLFHLAEGLLAAGVSLVLESNFNSRTASPRVRDLLGRLGAGAVQVHLDAPLETLLERSVRRVDSGERHPVHYKERDLLERGRAWLASGEPLDPRQVGSVDHDPLDLPFPLISLETADFAALDYPVLLGRVRGLCES